MIIGGTRGEELKQEHTRTRLRTRSQDGDVSGRDGLKALRGDGSKGEEGDGFCRTASVGVGEWSDGWGG